MNNEYIKSASTHFEFCPLDTVIKIISGRWKSIIICRLINQDLHFNQLNKEIPGCTSRMLALQLKELVGSKIIAKNINIEVSPVQISYSLTDIGQSLVPLILDMNKWGKEYLSLLDSEKFSKL